MIQPCLTGQRAEHPGGVQPGARAKDSSLGQPQQQGQFPGHDVAGVGDVNDHPVKAALTDLVRKAPDGGNGEVHFRDPVMIAAQQFDLADAVDDQITLAQIGKISGTNGDPVLKIGDGIPEILHLAGDLLFVLIHQDQLVGNALHRQRIGDVRTYVPQPQNCDDAFLCHACDLPFSVFTEDRMTRIRRGISPEKRKSGPACFGEAVEKVRSLSATICGDLRISNGTS